MTANALAQASQQRQDVPRCGVCDQPSARPLCHRCEAVAVTAERFGDPAELEAERNR